MSGAALPPIALDAVRKILAICQDNVHSKKPVKTTEKPTFRLELVPASHTFSPPPGPAKPRTVNQPKQRRQASKPMSVAPQSNAEGAESC